MGPLGVPELLFILVLALLIFGPKRLPEIGRTLGRGLSEFRRASSELKRSIETELRVDEPPAPARPRPPAPASPPPAPPSPPAEVPAPAIPPIEPQ
jgi:TatA/E family protein of Tat protein translocase